MRETPIPYDKIHDCIIVGGGPAGLYAGIYLSRFLRNIIIIDNKHSRATYIPKSYNIPGYPDGISGKQFLSNLLKQYSKYINNLLEDTVTNIRLDKQTHFFQVTTLKGLLLAKTIILATGTADQYPTSEKTHEAFINELIRQCPICDAYEYKNKNIAIIGNSNHTLNEGIYLRHFSDNITLFLQNGDADLNPKLLQRAATLGIKIYYEKIHNIIQLTKNKIKLCLEKTAIIFDIAYSAMGCKVNSELATNLGVETANDNCLIVDAHQETNLPGLYAIGDVVVGLNQIAVAIGQAAVAATAIHNKLLAEQED